jgi:hypothetical protein
MVTLILPPCLPAWLCVYAPQAVGGSGGRVLLLSVAEAAVVSELPLPRGAAAVAELAGAADAPGLLLVTTRDGALALWHVGTGQCLIETHADVVAAVRHPIVVISRPAPAPLLPLHHCCHCATAVTAVIAATTALASVCCRCPAARMLCTLSPGVTSQR